MSENPTSSSRLASRIPLCFGMVQALPFVLLRIASPPAYLMPSKAHLEDRTACCFRESAAGSVNLRRSCHPERTGPGALFRLGGGKRRICFSWLIARIWCAEELPWRKSPSTPPANSYKPPSPPLHPPVSHRDHQSLAGFEFPPRQSTAAP